MPLKISIYTKPIKNNFSHHIKHKEDLQRSITMLLAFEDLKHEKKKKPQ